MNLEHHQYRLVAGLLQTIDSMCNLINIYSASNYIIYIYNNHYITLAQSNLKVHVYNKFITSNNYNAQMSAHVLLYA